MIDEGAYVEALMADLEQELESGIQRTIQSIFIGGGTPSLFSAASVHAIIEGIRRRAQVDEDAEITLEANPGTAEQQKFSDYRACGINRLSIGVQSFDDDSLEQLGRVHDGSQARRAIEAALAAGFDSINIDLMFGLPKQSPDQAIADAVLACRFDPAHLSHYQLTIEPNTYFHKYTPVLPASDAIWDMQQHCHDIFERHGYTQYEVSAFSKAGKQCRHNINYWQFGDYIGIGAGAHGKLTDPARQSVRRRWKQRQPAAYYEQSLAGDACAGSSTLKPVDLVFEFLMNALRLREGFSYALFEQRTGIGRNALFEACGRVDPALLAVSDSGLSTSPRGYDFLNDVLQALLADND